MGLRTTVICGSNRWAWLCERYDFMRLLPSEGQCTLHIPELSISSNTQSTAYSRGWSIIADIGFLKKVSESRFPLQSSLSALDIDVQWVLLSNMVRIDAKVSDSIHLSPTERDLAFSSQYKQSNILPIRPGIELPRCR